MKVGMSELLVILAIVMLLFGGKKLPEVADGLGKAIRNFKRGMNAIDDEDVTPPQKQVQQRSSAAPLDESKSAERKA